MKSQINIVLTLVLCGITSQTYSMFPTPQSLKTASVEACKKTWEKIQDNKGVIGAGACTAALSFGAYKLYLSKTGQSAASQESNQELNPVVAHNSALIHLLNKIARSATQEEVAESASSSSTSVVESDEQLSQDEASPALSPSIISSFGSMTPSSLFDEELSPAHSLFSSAELPSPSNNAALPAAAGQSDELSDADSDSSSRYHTPFETPLTSPSEESASPTLDVDELNRRLTPIANQRRHGLELDLSALIK